MTATSHTAAGKKLVRLPVPFSPQNNAPAPVASASPASAPGPAEIAAQLETLNRTFTEFRNANDERLSQITARGSADVVTAEKVDRINSQVTAMDQTLRSMSDEVRASLARSGAADERRGLTPEARAYSDTFANWTRGRATDGELASAALAARVTNAMTTSNDPDGGFLLPQPVIGAMDRVLGLVSAMRSICEVRPVSGAIYKKPYNVGGAASGWVGETGTRSQTANSTLSEMAFAVHEMYAMPAATQTLLDDAATDVEAWLGEEGAIAFAEKEAPAFITGDGANKPRGILGYTMIANASWTHGKVGFTVGGHASLLNDPDALITLQHALKSGHRGAAQWLMNDATKAIIRKLKDTTNQYILQPGLVAGAPDTLLGKPIVIDDSMPDVGANAFPVAWGDFRRAYVIVDRMGIRTLRDPYTSKPYVLFYMTKRVGGGIQNFEALKFLKIST